MKNRLIKALSILTVLAMLTAFLPAALSESSEADVEETPVLSEAPAPEEEAGEEAEPAAAAEEPAPAPAAAEEPVPAPAPVEEPAPAPAPAPAEEEPAPAPAPAAVEEPAPAPAAVEEPAPASAAVEEPAPAPAAEEPAPAEAEEEEVPAPVVEEEEPAPEEEEEPAAEAEEEQPAQAAGEEPADPDAEDEEPVALNVGETLSGTVFAGKELKIRLWSVDAKTILLTLTMNAGQNIHVRINDRDADLTGIETGDADKAVYTCEIQAAESACYDLTLCAQADTEFLLEAEATTTWEAAEEPAEKPEETEPAAEGAADGEPAGEAAVNEETENSAAEDNIEEETAEDPEEAETEFVRVMVIRENGTNLYNAPSQDAEAAGKLNHGDIYWIRPVGGMWGEIVLDDGNGPLYLNLNNVVLLRGEVGYDIPIRKVRLVSTLDGMTQIEEGTEITITAEFSGFMEDEIADITWQYRTENDAEDAFRNIDGVNGLVYTYSVTDENVHNEWRIVLTLNS